MVHSDYSPLDLSRFAEPDRYKFLMGTVIPRPIALVTSLSREGVLNAAPFSQFVVISVTPSLLGFLAHDSENGLNATVRNFLKPKQSAAHSLPPPTTAP